MHDDSGETIVVMGGTIIFLTSLIIAAVTKLCISTNNPGTNDNSGLSLGDLAKLKLTNSNTTPDLLDAAYWNSVNSAYDKTVIQILPSTVLGFFNSSNEWKYWALQNMPSPPAWLSANIKPYLEVQIELLKAKALATHNATLATVFVQDFAGAISGYTLAVLDFVSFNGITALRVFLDTGNPMAAVCATYPSQLGVLYNQAFDPSVTREMRAQYLGNALAMTSLLLLLAGKDGFTQKFQGALDRVGLSDAWSTVKPYLSKIGGTISSKASSLTLTILEELANRFPHNSVWATGYASDRIVAMAEVLHEKGFSNDVIEQKISGLVQSADSAGRVDDVPLAADEESYQDGGGIKVKLSTENQMYLYDDTVSRAYIPATLLEKEVPGFKVGQKASLKVYYWKNGVTVYHYYEGGKNWVPTVPQDVGKPRDVMAITVQMLTKEDFIKNIRNFGLTNDYLLPWAAERTLITDVSLVDDQLTINAVQDPSVEGVWNFAINAQSPGQLEFNVGLTYVDLTVSDAFGGARDVRLYHDGHTPPLFKVQSGKEFFPVDFVSFDGTRLKLHYQRPVGDSTATVYLNDPSVLYSVGNVVTGSNDYLVMGASRVYEIDKVKPLRNLEMAMVKSTSNYDIARIGAEIAYTVAQQKLGLKDVVFVDPAIGGRDLYTTDAKVVIQARMLSRTHDALTTKDLQADVLQQLNDLVGKLGQDFEYNPSATTGYAILSYADNQWNIHTIILELKKS